MIPKYQGSTVCQESEEKDVLRLDIQLVSDWESFLVKEV